MLRRKGRGFTLVELLVVITIIGILMALLLPAVNYAVENARSRTCMNNMRQLALGMVSTESRKERFPGYTNRLGNLRASWQVEIMPAIERQDIYDLWANGTATSTYIETFVCPSDPPDNTSGAVNSYVANAGYQKFILNHAGATGDNERETIANGVCHNYFPDKGTLNVRGPSITANQFLDGVTNTLLVSENVQATTWDAISSGSNQAAASDKIATVFVWHQTTNNDRKINGNKNTAALNADTARPSSQHPGGVNAAFADGHTIWLKQDIDHRVYVQLMTPRHTDVVVPNTDKAYVLSEADYR